ncbi:hypothetical protein [Stenotrophomonas sp. Iso1]|uniref:hypothetical protein n=1 Tax=Stenotrophomonas sp. Iso1 TaxID=2977283 RepID=UPI0022B7B5E4|nr:hypothetical protein [Stenotrophomonas sp. Iso1]
MRMVCLLLCLPLAASAAPLLRSEGVATTTAGTVAYREVHWQRGAGEAGERWVQYLCPGGEPFARKQLRVSGPVQAPGYRLEDRRSGQAASIEITDSGVQLSWKEDTQARTRTQRLPLPADAVIDAGFDAAVRSHWQRLMQGERLALQFLVPGRQRYYPVQVQRTGAVRWQGMPAQSIEVQLDAWYGEIAPVSWSSHFDVAEVAERLFEQTSVSGVVGVGQLPGLLGEDLATGFQRHLGRDVAFESITPEAFGAMIEPLIGPASAAIAAFYGALQSSPTNTISHDTSAQALFGIAPRSVQQWLGETLG